MHLYKDKAGLFFTDIRCYFIIIFIYEAKVTKYIWIPGMKHVSSYKVKNSHIEKVYFCEYKDSDASWKKTLIGGGKKTWEKM